MNYYVVAIDYPRRIVDSTIFPACRQAVVDPEITRSEVISRIRSGEYKDISFIHLITMNDVPEDVTAELIGEASLANAHDAIDAVLSPADRQDAAFDHSRDLRKHERYLR